MSYQCEPSGCSGCGTSGGCGGCGICCGGTIILCKEEVQVLMELGQFAFLPVIQSIVQGELHYEPVPEDRETMPVLFSDLVASLQRKQLISIDPDIPLKHAVYGIPVDRADVHYGSLALTAQGQEVLNWISPDEYIN